MKKRLLLFAALLAFVAPARAQLQPSTANLTAQDAGPCTTPHACLQITIPYQAASSVIQLSGTWSGTVQFEASTTPNGNFSAISGIPINGSAAVSSATATGLWRFNVAAVTLIRVRVSTYASGTIVAAITASNASSAQNQGGGSGPGDGVDSLDGDSILFCNSGSTGAVGLLPCDTVPANSVFAGPAGSPGLGSFQTTPNINIAGTAAQATALAAAPTQCTGLQVSQGVDVHGNAQCISFAGGAITYTSSHTLDATNRSQLVIFNCSSPCTASLPATSLGTSWSVAIQGGKGYAVVTVSPNGLLLNTSSASLTFPEPGISTFVTTDGTNYFSSLPSTFVQQAALFTGSDAGVIINACLTLAHTIVASANVNSGVCDARGLTGILTATHHISIPASTSLLWGQAQLTISDSGTNDAVEVASGSTLIGMNQSGPGTVPAPLPSGYIGCGIAGCTTVKNPLSSTVGAAWVSIEKMALLSDGAMSTVLDLSSISHAHIEDDRLIMGTGGGSWGIFGSTSAGDLDSTNTLLKHNEIDPQSANDTCMSLIGIFNVIQIEANVCVLPAENTGTVGFQLAKDTNSNYPNNDEFYGNDCESSSASFNQICFNIVNADSITIGPNNRCEQVYNCFQFPIDGSAVGIHLLDPYIAVSAHTVIKPNEPAAAQVGIDNNGPNWQPSIHFGFHDEAAQNLLANPNFEAWTSSTALSGWGAVSGTTFNATNSSIYAQQSSASSPVDATTQGLYNVVIGDNATLGLGINSGCIQIDATYQYTLAFRILASTVGINFRPGFRFYSDPNCTEADKITNIATNARVLSTANYGGTSQVAINGNGGSTLGNWQSTNASLTYNNGITCNCSVTGADWNVAAANTWTPTANFAVTFRVPNAYSLSTTIARSMRVAILENTAANPNQIFVDDVTLSQGAVSPNLAPHPLPDTNPTLFGAVTLPHFTVATLPSATAAPYGVGSVVVVTDATAFTAGTCTGSGSDTVFAIDNGSAWVCQ